MVIFITEKFFSVLHVEKSLKNFSIYPTKARFVMLLIFFTPEFWTLKSTLPPCSSRQHTSIHKLDVCVITKISHWTFFAYFFLNCCLWFVFILDQHWWLWYLSPGEVVTPGKLSYGMWEVVWGSCLAEGFTSEVVRSPCPTEFVSWKRFRRGVGIIRVAKPIYYVSILESLPCRVSI